MERRQTAVIKTAERSYKIVDNLFPASVRDRLFRSNDERIPERPSSDFPNVDGEQYSKIKNRIPTIGHPTRRFSNSSGKSDAESGASVQFPPIADLFTDTTIIFADIAGFTAWSSEREPTQVFQLLEALFQEFDNEAKKLGVFKVETIGDCYGKDFSLVFLLTTHQLYFLTTCAKLYNFRCGYSSYICSRRGWGPQSLHRSCLSDD
jgi:hypothetical protein